MPRETPKYRSDHHPRPRPSHPIAPRVSVSAPLASALRKYVGALLTRYSQETVDASPKKGTK